MRSKITQTAYAVARLDTLWFFAPLSLAAFCVLLLMTFTTTASANSAHAFNSSFGASTSTPANPYPLSAPTSVAVDQTSHDVYVTDPAHFRVEKFDATGHFVLMFGRNVNKTEVEASGTQAQRDVCTAASGNVCEPGVKGAGGEGQFSDPEFVAVDSSSGDVYVGDNGTDTVYKFSSGGAYLSANAGITATAGPFGSLAGLAVDSSGDLWVYSGAAEMFEFEQDGTFVQNWGTSDGALPSGITVDSAGNLYVVTAFRQVEELTSTGERVGFLTPEREVGLPYAVGLAIDPGTGALYVDFGESIEQIVAGTVVETFGTAQLAGAEGLSVNRENGTVYAADSSLNVVDGYDVALEVSTGAASEVHAGSAKLEGTVNPEGSPVSDCRFEYGSTTEYGQSVPCEGTIGTGSSGVVVHAAVSGLEAATTYHFRVVASDTSGTADGQDGVFTTLPLPVISALSTGNILPSSAELHADINPSGVPVSLCEFEYGTSTSYTQTVPCGQSEAQIGSGTAPVPVSAVLSGLHEGTTYHWRLLAANANGQSTSTDQTFIYTTGAGGLPDNREYELVTPVRKNGALIGAVVGGIATSVAENGQRLIAPSLQCFDAAQSCIPDREYEGPAFEFSRTASGWVTHPLTPSASSAEGITPWSDNANTGMLLYSADTPPQTADELYTLQADTTPHNIGPTAETTSFEALNVFRATSDYSTVVYEGREPLWAFDETEPGHESLYEYPGTDTGEPALVGVSGGAGSTDLISDCGTLSGEAASGPGRYNSLSSDGRTVYFAVDHCSTGSGVNTGVEVPVQEVYVRIDQRDTELLSKHATVGCTTTECLDSPPANAVFEGASTDGTTALFASTQQLTDTASQDSTDSASNCSQVTAGAGGCNLYESVCPNHCENPSERELLDVSAGDPKPQVQDVVALSPDGSHVYFVADGALTATPNQQGETAHTGDPNLYVFEHAGHGAEQHIKFIARLSPNDSEEYTQGYEADVTPEGRYLVFMSHRALTADDTRPEGPSQVYRYDSQTGTLIRLSQGNGGFNDDGNSGSGNASIVVPSFTTVSGPARSDPTMSHDGSYIFFQSPVGLTPDALDDVSIGGSALAQNIYEWHEGNVYLISDGKDTSPKSQITKNMLELVGSDATGANVFFTTYDSLVPQDTDTQRDIYDAHACSSTEPCLPPAPSPPTPCHEEECHNAGVPATAVGVPASATFTGSGNLIQAPAPVVKAKAKSETRAQKLARALSACRRDKKKSRRVVCEKQARGKYGAPKKAKRAGHNGRGK